MLGQSDRFSDDLQPQAQPYTLSAV